MLIKKSLPSLEESQLRERVNKVKQLLFWTMKEEASSQIALEESVRQEVIAIMAEAIIAVVQRKKEETNEHVEES
jgi:hypothetical protein